MIRAGAGQNAKKNGRQDLPSKHVIQEVQTEFVPNGSELTVSRLEAFLNRCLILDLEVDQETKQIRAVGALWRNGELRISNSSSEEAVRKLDEFGKRANFVVGHNIVAHDRRFIEKYLPESRLLKLPVVDTLYLSPLAFPQRPYHRLVKDYKLIGAEPNDPVADCKLTLKLLEDCWRVLEGSLKERLGLLSIYRSCFEDSDIQKEASELKLNGTGLFLQTLGGKRFSRERICRGFVHFAREKHRPEEKRTVRACPHSIRHRLLPLFDSPKTRPAVAYSLAWLMVAGTESVLPRWVHHQYPEAAKFIRTIRGVSCGQAECKYCPKQHDQERQLKKYFGFPGFRATPATTDGESLQKRIVEERIAGKSVLAIMPTGAGKSVGFQLPAIVHNEQTGALSIVISPLQALMKDQVDNLNSRTESPTLAATINGLQTMIERREVLENIKLGSYALLYISPEQLRNTSFRSAISQREIAAWVFDEAHCISKWGHDFRPDYLYAARFIREFSEGQGVPISPIACFTATAKLDVRQEIRSQVKRELDIDLKELACDRIDRKNLHFSIEEIPNSDKVRRIDELLRHHIADTPDGIPKGAAIIYARSRHRTKTFAERLLLEGWKAKHFHGGLDSPEKKQVQDAFVSGETPVIVATNAFGMGIDKENVRLVVHADVPSSIENYLQEAGRAGRDGQPANCVLLFAKDDLERQFDLVSQGQLTKRDIAQILRAVRMVRRRDAKEIVVSPGELLRTPDTDLSFHSEDRYADTRVRTAIAWLERAKFMLRDENRTRLFQGVPAVRDLAKSLEKLEALELSSCQKKRWAEVLGRLHHADRREGIEVDEIALFPSFRTRFKSLQRQHPDDPARVNRALTQQIFRTLHHMTRAGLLESGFHFSAWIRHKTASKSGDRLEEIATIQEKLLTLLREQSPEVGPGDGIDISIPQLQEQLRVLGVNMVRDALLTLLKGWERKVTKEDLPLSFQSHGRRRLSVQLNVSWDELVEQLNTRNEVGRVILETLGFKADKQGAVGVRLVLFSLNDLHDALEQRLGFGDQISDPLTTLQKTLLFLNENQVIQLEKGLSVFRQAMTLRFYEETKGKRYTDNDYRPLQKHYEQRIFQVHAIGRYVEESQQGLGSRGHRYVRDYFSLTDQEFKQHYFPDKRRSIKRATSAQSYTRIVEKLNNRHQERIVTAPKNRNLLVLAGPGSGKTRVVVHRAAYLLMVERIRPERLLVVCFNRSAMHELRVRLRELVGDLARRVAVHTYHSLALRLTERSISERIKASGQAQIDFDEIIEEANLLLAGPKDIIGAEPAELRDRLLSGFEYVLVDEYQDIDAEQYQMITHIARRRGQEEEEERWATILAVGDDDQNIYKWRGANIQFLRQFEEDFDAQPHYLVENYRSTNNIISVSNALIQSNQDRMKAEHSIRINNTRASALAGGRWETLDPRYRGRVSLIEVQGRGLAAATLAEIERLKGLNDSLDWTGFAVLAWSHAELAPVRALLEKKGVPVRRSIPQGLPRLNHIREFKRLLVYLERKNREAICIPRLRKKLGPICGVGAAVSVWTAMADRMLATLEEQIGNESILPTQVTEAIHQGLAEHHRSHIIGDGVLVSTIHSAKGMEFDHVLVLGGKEPTGDKKPRSEEEERRLYYVAMTRARETLTLIDRFESPNPYFRQIRKHVLNRTTTLANGKSPELTNLAYEVLGMRDIYLDLAGRKEKGHPIHQSLADMRAGDLVSLKGGSNGRVKVLNQQGAPVGLLSKATSGRWPQERLASVDQVRVLGMVSRTKDDSIPEYLDCLQVDRWEVPILEVRTRNK